MKPLKSLVKDELQKVLSENTDKEYDCQKKE